jgi:hypothetical protein
MRERAAARSDAGEVQFRPTFAHNVKRNHYLGRSADQSNVNHRFPAHRNLTKGCASR